MSAERKAAAKIWPFRFPTTLVPALPSTKRFQTYGSYKPLLRKHFGKQCVYCRFVDQPLALRGSFHVEHYLPKDPFVDLIVEPSNLLFACARCNIFKSTHWASSGDEKVLNPTNDVMSDHVQYKDFVDIRPKTTRGKFHVELFGLSRAESVRRRKAYEQIVLGLGLRLHEAKKSKKPMTKAREAVINDLISTTSDICALDEETVRRKFRL